MQTQPHAPTTDELAQASDQLQGLGNAVKLQQLQVFEQLDRSEGWREDGARSLEDWIAYRYAMPWKSASDHVATMRALRGLPKIASVFEQGLVCWDVLVTLCTFVQPEEDAEWAERVQTLNAAQVRTCARVVRRRRREEAARMHGERSLHAWWDSTGDLLRLNGIIPGDAGALVRKTLDRIADQLGPGPDGAFASREQRLADALVELAATRVADDPDPDRATLVVRVEARELSKIHGKGFIEDGPDVPSEIVRRLACDARIEINVTDANGNPVGIGRVSRVVPPALRRRLRERDGACVACGRQIGLHAHHRIHWVFGGRTDLDNLELLCRRCHRLVHDARFRLVRDRFGQPKLVRPDGRVVSSRPMPLRPEVRDRVLGPDRTSRVAVRC